MFDINSSTQQLKKCKLIFLSAHKFQIHFDFILPPCAYIFILANCGLEEHRWKPMGWFLNSPFDIFHDISCFRTAIFVFFHSFMKLAKVIAPLFELLFLLMLADIYPKCNNILYMTCSLLFVVIYDLTISWQFIIY